MLASSGITGASGFQWSFLTKVLRTDDIVDVEVDVGGKRKRAAGTSGLPRPIYAMINHFFGVPGSVSEPQMFRLFAKIATFYQ